VAGNLGALRRLVPRGGPASLLRGEGGWSAVLRIPATAGEEDRVLDLLEAHDVLVHPGYFFDFPREAYLVLSLLPRPADFEEAVARILRVL
jgi:aspartate/methionine/tyrosine aminotransferase